MSTHNDIIYYSVMLEKIVLSEKGKERAIHKEIGLRHRAEEAAKEELAEIRETEPSAYLMEWRTRGVLES